MIASPPFAPSTTIPRSAPSVGGLLATFTTLRARDAGLSLALQVLLYPNTDLRPGRTIPHASSTTAW